MTTDMQNAGEEIRFTVDKFSAGYRAGRRHR